MAYRRKTLRKMPATSRKLAKLIGELGSIERRLKNLLPEIEQTERMYQAELKRQAHYNKGNGEGIEDLLEERME